MKRRLFAGTLGFLLTAILSLGLWAQTSTATTTKTTKKKTTAKTTTKKKAATTTQKKAATTTAAKTPKDVIILPASMGAVKFMHTAHSKDRQIKCETCHHSSKPEKPAKAAQQACRDCHTKVVAAPMKTKLQAAFHNPTATAGTCIDCHKAENAKGKKAPTKCADCHKKENVSA